MKKVQNGAPRGVRRLGRLGMFAVAGIALFGGGAGCLSGADSNATPAALAASAVEGESWVEAWDGAGGSGRLSADTIISTLGLDQDQAAVVTAAVAEMQAKIQEHRREMQGRGPKGGNRPGPEGMPGGFGEFESPMLGFLEAVVPVLGAGQVESLVALVEESHGDRGPRGPRGGGGPGGGGPQAGGPQDGRGPRGGGPHGGFLARALQNLDLTSEQQTALRDLGMESREEFRALREGFADGSITAEQLRDNAKSLREDMETQLAVILTDDQVAALEAALAEHRAEVTQRRIDGLADGVERRTQFLIAVLQLDDAQSAAVAGVLQATVAERTSILEQLRDGGIEIEDALYAGYQLATQTATEIRALLSAEQAAVFDALKQLLPGNRGPGGR